MTFTFSKNLFIRSYCWFVNRIAYPIKNHYYRNKKTHYECCVCGNIEAPYFKDDPYCRGPITDDYGWHKLDNGKYNRWICHRCADHWFEDSDTTIPRNKRESTWDEWQEEVKEHNEKILSLIKAKDPEYYEYWFNGGRETELFGYEEGDEDD